MAHQLKVVAIATAAAAVLAGCGGGSRSGTGASSTPEPLHLDEHANGHTIDVPPGQRIVVTLHSTYWRIDVPTRGLRPVGSAETSPSPCHVTGAGCGTVTETFTATTTGTTTLRAARTSCGEALRCTGAQGAWTVTIHVG